ncbi:hypothetical protein L6164_024371 [Bauhinia variegata]|uniref:Uncharacterized protein n=1 Tax=Bauhinia variegata TaxID=167791 RepID=A0ACB9LXD1_BAUVA|nr:hypothetical protein L6164_024371 [Bauhinia variegata]
MTVETGRDDPRDQFPVGMRVLAVDDDPTCLLVLETLLRRCQYHVTTTSQATTALKMLRENRDKFDLVISDVHMPDMDGFKLLELVGLEMDLPVIMLSANGDPKLVMKGITHGACDYLLKPVRIEELKNIWQHVIRRKKFDRKDGNKGGNQDKAHSGSSNGLGSAGIGNSDQNGKLTKKRKDQDEEEDEENEDGPENDDPSTQKKPRVVWSVELHRKFVAAVNQLGIDKAVPKKILDLMNVEKLTRENVASHLQKYRLYLKRISCVANQQANMVAALGSADPSYLRMSSLSGLGHLQTLNGSGQFQNNVFKSFPPSGMIGRLNTPAGLGVHGLPSSGILPLGHHGQNLNNSMNNPLNFPSTIVGGNQNASAIQGVPVSMGLDQLRQNKAITTVEDLATDIDDKTILTITNKLTDPKARAPLMGVTNNSFMLETQGSRGYENLSSVASQHSEFSLSSLDHGRCSDNWSTAVQSSGIHPNSSYPSTQRFRQAALSLTDNMPSTRMHVSNPSAASSVTSLSAQSHDSITDMHSKGTVFTNSPAQVSNNAPFQGWDDHNQDFNFHSMNSLIPANGAVDPSGHATINSAFHRNLEFNVGDLLQMKHDEVAKSAKKTLLKPNHGYIMDQQKAQHSRISNNLGSLEDLVSTMMKQERNKVKLMEGEFVCDSYSGGASM